MEENALQPTLSKERPRTGRIIIELRIEEFIFGLSIVLGSEIVTIVETYACNVRFRTLQGSLTPH